MVDPYAAAKSLWKANALPLEMISWHLHLSAKPDPAVNSSFRLGTVAQVSCAIVCSLYLMYPMMFRLQLACPVSQQHTFIS